MDVDEEHEELLPVYPSLHRTRGGLRVHLQDGSMVAWSTFRQRPGEWTDYTGILVELLELAGGNPAKKRRIDFNDGASTGARCCTGCRRWKGAPSLAGMTKQKADTTELSSMMQTPLQTSGCPWIPSLVLVAARAQKFPKNSWAALRP